MALTIDQAKANAGSAGYWPNAIKIFGPRGSDTNSQNCREAAGIKQGHLYLWQKMRIVGWCDRNNYDIATLYLQEDTVLEKCVLEYIGWRVLPDSNEMTYLLDKLKSRTKAGGAKWKEFSDIQAFALRYWDPKDLEQGPEEDDHARTSQNPSPTATAEEQGRSSSVPDDQGPPNIPPPELPARPGRGKTTGGAKKESGSLLNLDFDQGTDSKPATKLSTPYHGPKPPSASASVSPFDFVKNSGPAFFGPESSVTNTFSPSSSKDNTPNKNQKSADIESTLFDSPSSADPQCTSRNTNQKNEEPVEGEQIEPEEGKKGKGKRKSQNVNRPTLDDATSALEKYMKGLSLDGKKSKK